MMNLLHKINAKIFKYLKSKGCLKKKFSLGNLYMKLIGYRLIAKLIANRSTSAECKEFQAWLRTHQKRSDDGNTTSQDGCVTVK